MAKFVQLKIVEAVQWFPGVKLPNLKPSDEAGKFPGAYDALLDLGEDGTMGIFSGDMIPLDRQGNGRGRVNWEWFNSQFIPLEDTDAVQAQLDKLQQAQAPSFADKGKDNDKN